MAIIDVKGANCLSMDVFTESSKISLSRQLEKFKNARGCQLEKCGVARALEPIHAESSRTLQQQAQEDSGTDVEGTPWETDLMSWSERARSKPTRESVSQVKQLQQRHLYMGHLGCQRSCWANPFTVKQHGLHRAIEKFEEMRGQLTNRVLLCHCEKDGPHTCLGEEVPERSRPRNTTESGGSRGIVPSSGAPTERRDARVTI